MFDFRLFDGKLFDVIFVAILIIFGWLVSLDLWKECACLIVISKVESWWEGLAIKLWSHLSLGLQKKIKPRLVYR